MPANRLDADLKADIVRPGLAVLIAISFLNPISTTLFLPSLPAMADDFRISPAAMQWSITAYILATAVLMLVVGPLSDRFGRRPLVILSIAGYVLGSILCLSATEFWVLLLGRTVQALAIGGQVVARAMVRDSWDLREATGIQGYVAMGLAVGPLIGPPLGGIVHDLFGWRATFVVMLLLGLVTLAAVVLALPETSRGRSNSTRRLVAGYRLIAGSAQFWWLTLTLGMVFGSYFTFIGGGAFISVRVLGLSGAEFGLLFASAAFGFILGSFATGRFAPRIGPQRMMLAGNGLACTAVLVALPFLLAGDATRLTIFGPLFLVGMGNGAAVPCIITAIVSVQPRFAGSAAGLSGCFQMAFSAMMSVVGGWVAATWSTPGPLFAVMAATAVASVGCTLLWMRSAGAGRGR